LSRDLPLASGSSRVVYNVAVVYLVSSSSSFFGWNSLAIDVERMDVVDGRTFESIESIIIIRKTLNSQQDGVNDLFNKAF
jgi:hypothetical protein